MASHQLLTRITGDPLWADRCEELAFNSLPAALGPSGRAVHYITSANSVDLDDEPKKRRQFQNRFAMQAYLPGVDRYRCCPHNYGMRFPLVLRVPAWCADPVVEAGGSRVDTPAGPAFTRIERTWSDGDRVTLRFPQHTTVRTWSDNHGSVSVDRGPLTYSLRIGEEHRRIGGTDRFPAYEVHATGPWNYGLVLDPRDPAASFRTRAVRAVGRAPFTLGGSPLSMTARARRIPEWTADDEHVVAPLQDSPARSTEPVEEVTLVPVGAARLRITSFPTADPRGTARLADRWYRIGNRHAGKVLGVDLMSTADSAHVVQFTDNGTDGHLWRLL